jgi:hypothetical protein
LTSGVLLLLSVVDRWLSIFIYESIGETGWYLLGGGLPYLERSDDAEEFFRYRSQIWFFIGLVHFGIGGVFLLLPDFWVLLFAWVLLFLIFAFMLRYHFIQVIIEINEKYERKNAS